MANALANKLRETVFKYVLEGKLTEEFQHENLKSIDNGLFQNFLIPSNWDLVTVKESCYIHARIGWQALSKNEHLKIGEYMLITGTDFKDGFVNYTTCVYVDKNRYDMDPKIQLQNDDILITKDGTLGKVAVVKNLPKPATLNGGVFVVRPDDRFNKDYIELIFRSSYFNRFINDIKKSTTIKHLNQSKLHSFLIPVPSLEEQARIVTRVDELMTKIDEYEKLENELVELKKNFPGDMKAAVLQTAMQGKLTDQNELERPLFFDKKVNMDDYDYDLPDNWTVVKMSSVSELYTGNSIPEAIKKSKYMGLSDGMNYIGTKDVGFDHVIDYENGVKIPFGEPKFKVAKKEATLLCVEGGSAGKKMGVIKENVCFGNKLCSFNAGKHIDSKFQYYVIQSPIFVKMFAESISGMIGGVSVNKLKDMLIPLPPIEEQRRIVEKLDKILPLCEEFEKEMA